jgi:Uma2 family endonuclease
MPADALGELLRGEWIPSTFHTLRHGEVAAEIGFRVAHYVRSHPEWVATMGEAGMKLEHSPDTLRGSDVAVFRASRMPNGKGVEGWLEGVAELTIEVVEDSEDVGLVIAKVKSFLAAGAQIGWVLDPRSSSVFVVELPDQIRELNETDMLDGGELLPGFTCPVAEIFGRPFDG